MTTAIVETRLWVMMSDKLGLDQDKIKLTDSFAYDLGIDSLDMVELFMEIEKDFGVKITDEDAERLTTVKALVDFLHTHLS